MAIHDNPELVKLTRKFLHKRIKIKTDTGHAHSNEEGTVVSIDMIQEKPALKIRGEFSSEEFYCTDNDLQITI